jgi:hypothetical protein
MFGASQSGASRDIPGGNQDLEHARGIEEGLVFLKTTSAT